MRHSECELDFCRNKKKAHAIGQLSCPRGNVCKLWITEKILRKMALENERLIYGDWSSSQKEIVVNGSSAIALVS